MHERDRQTDSERRQEVSLIGCELWHCSDSSLDQMVLSLTHVPGEGNPHPTQHYSQTPPWIHYAFLDMCVCVCV